MARFRIVSSRRSADPAESEFDIQVESPSLKVGDTFTLWETRHPVNFPIVRIISTSEKTTLFCRQPIPWSGAFEAHEVDTDNPDVARRYGYKSP